MLATVSCSGGKDEGQGGDTSRDSDPPSVTWSVLADAADGLAANERTVVVVGGESVAAFEDDTGELRWDAEVIDTNNSRTPVAISDGVVVVALRPGYFEAFDEEDGEPVELSADVQHPREITDIWGLEAAGLRFEDGRLLDGERTLWENDAADEPPAVARLGDYVIINDFDELSVVDSTGEVVLSESPGTAMYDQSVVVVTSDDVAFTITSDGQLWRIA